MADSHGALNNPQWLRDSRGVDPGESAPLDPWIGRHRGHIMMVLCGLVLLGAVAFLLRYPPLPRGAVLQIATALPTSTPIPTSTPAPLRVYVSGAIAYPDVYQLPPGSIAKDALFAAGGALPGADLARINLAQQLFDQQQVHISLAGEPLLPQTQFSPSGNDCVDLNTATLGEFDELPGIGPVYAQRIVEYRAAHGPLKDVEELSQVKGIGPITLEKIRDLVCVH